MRSIDTAIIALALTLGAGISYVDSRPTWDDTGVTAGSVFLVAALLSGARPRLFAAVAVCVGAWIPAVEITRAGNYGSLLALAVAAAGALCGAAARITAAGRPV